MDISENNKKLFGKFEDKSAFCILNLYAQMPENTIYTYSHWVLNSTLLLSSQKGSKPAKGGEIWKKGSYGNTYEK